MELSFKGSGCGKLGQNGESNESRCEQFGKGVTAKGVECEEVEWEKCAV